MKHLLLLLLVLVWAGGPALSQEVEVSGKVTDHAGNPLVGVSSRSGDVSVKHPHFSSLPG